MYVKYGGFFIVDFAKVVTHTFDTQPFALRVNHVPVGEVVQGSTPQHGFFTACVHRHITAHARRIGGSRINGEHQTCLMRGFFHSAGYYACAAMDNRMSAVQTCQLNVFDAAMLVEFFGIDDCAVCVQRYCATGITRTAAARDNNQVQFD